MCSPTVRLARIFVAFAALWAGCDEAPPIAESRAALATCAVVGDCPVFISACVEPLCDAHVCRTAVNLTACPTGCSSPSECEDGNPCTDDDCVSTACVHVPVGSPAGTDGGAPAGCCDPSTVASDCASPTACQAPAACTSGSCTFVSNGSSAICCDGRSECGGTATCTGNTCSCAVAEKFCVGASSGMGRCVPTAGCCVDGDCPVIANATGTCTVAGSCTYACTTSFGDCNNDLPAGNGCESNLDTDVNHCGACATACAAGSECEAPACTTATCSLVPTGGEGCCSVPADCSVAGVCQTLSCSAHTCVYDVKPISGCCATTEDCPLTGDPCVLATCVSNVCGTMAQLDCFGDGGLIHDLSSLSDAGVADAGDEPDLAVPNLRIDDLSVGGGGCDVGRSRAPQYPRFALYLLALLLFFRRASMKESR